MSLLHPTDDDYEFSAANSDTGHRMTLNRAWRLTELLRQIRRILGRDISVELGSKLADEIDAALDKTNYDEANDGHWRLGAHNENDPPPALKKKT